MAKSVLELAVGTGQWNAGLRKAKSALDNFTQSQGGIQSALAKDSEKMQQFVRMMGQMDSTSKTAKGQMNDYKSTIEQLTMQYNRMTDAQKQTIGQDYLQSIEQLKQRYQSVNEEIQEMNRMLSQTPSSVPVVGNQTATSSPLDNLTGKFTKANLYAWGIEKGIEGFQQLGEKIVDVAQQSSNLAVSAEGIERAYARLGRGDLMAKLKEETHGTVSELQLMKAAVKFNDFKLPVEELGTMLAFAQQKAKDTGQSIDYMVDSIVTGLGRKSLMILDNLGLSAAQIKEKMKETGDMTKAVAEIIREEMAKAGDYVETASDRIARAAADNEDAMLELGKAMNEALGVGSLDEFQLKFETAVIAELQQAVGVIDLVKRAWNELVGPIEKVAGKTVTVIERFELIRDISNSPRVGAMFQAIKNYLTTLISPALALYNTLKDIAQLVSGSRLNQTISRTTTIIGNSLPAVVTPGSADVTTTTSDDDKKGKGTGKGGGTTRVLTKEEENNKRIKELTEEYIKASDERRAAIRKEIAELQERNREIEKLRNEALGITAKALTQSTLSPLQQMELEAANVRAALPGAGSPEEYKEMKDYLDALLLDIKKYKGELNEIQQTKGFSGLTEGSLAAWISGQQSAAKGMQLGGADYLATSANIVDAKTLSAVMKTAVENGIEIDASTREELWEKIINAEDIPDNTWEELVAVINEHLAALGIDPIKIDLKTGNISKAGKETADSWKAAAQAVGSVGNALQQINDPAAKVVGIVGEAVANIALGFAQATAKDSKLGVFGWIAAVAGGLGTMISTIAAIKSATAQQHYAQGGIVPGNDYTDNTPVLVSSGELILNRSQQDNIAQQLQGNTFGDNFALSAKFDGEDFWIMLNRNSVRRGRGTIALNKH